MPFLFFLKKNTNIFTQADLVAIFDSQKTFDENSVLTENLYEKASITEDEFNGIRKNNKEIISCVISNGVGNITFRELVPSFSQSTDLSTHINTLKDQMSDWIKIFPSKPITSIANSYLIALNSLNADNILLEANGYFQGSLESYLEDKGYTVLNPLQLR
jgi:hypothetical protein